MKRSLAQKQLAHVNKAGGHINHENNEANNTPGLKVGNKNTGRHTAPIQAPAVPLTERLPPPPRPPLNLNFNYTR